MLYFLPTPIGNLKDFTLRGLEILSRASIIICEDTRVCKSLLHLIKEKLSTTSTPKEILSLHTHNEKEFQSTLERLDFENEIIVYLSDAGMPSISDPGSFLVRYAQSQNISYEVLPGANAALTAFVASGFGEKNFIFLGFLNNAGKERKEQISSLCKSEFISVVYESPKRVLKLIEEIAQIDEEREIFAVKELTKKFEKKFKNSAKNLLEMLKKENLNGEWTLIIKGACKGACKELILNESDILSLDLPPKAKIKLLARLGTKNTKALYLDKILTK